MTRVRSEIIDHAAKLQLFRQLPPHVCSSMQRVAFVGKVSLEVVERLPGLPRGHTHLGGDAIDDALALRNAGHEYRVVQPIQESGHAAVSRSAASSSCFLR